MILSQDYLYSCTTFVVEDSMEGPNGIEASWRFASHALRFGAGCAIHLSKLRPAGHTNDKGLVATGPVSFGKIYSALNETLRRGGAYKNGAIVLHLDLSHPDVVDFITATRSELPWVKRCVDIDDEMWAFADQDTKDALIYGIKSGDVWLNKIRHSPTGERIYGNVCLEVYLPSRGTCLLQHVNLGSCTLDNLQEAFDQACPSCVISMAGQVLENLESTLPQKSTDKLGLECSVLPTSSDVQHQLRRLRTRTQAYQPRT